MDQGIKYQSVWCVPDHNPRAGTGPYRPVPVCTCFQLFFILISVDLPVLYRSIKLLKPVSDLDFSPGYQYIDPSHTGFG